MCRPNERTHKHHIIPRYMGGTDDPENLVEVSVTQHAMFHFCNYQLWGNGEDRLAWRGLAGLITPDDAALEAQALGRKKAGNKNKENKTGVCGRSPEKMSEDGRKGGKITYECGLGVHNRSKEQMFEDGKKGGESAYKNKRGFHSWTEEQKVEHNRKAGKRARELGVGIHSQTHEEKVQCGRTTYELGVGVHALTTEERSDMGRVGGIKTSSQVWRCTITGYETNAGALTVYQRNRGVETSNRIRIK
jgi:general stress protein YciG